MEIRTAEVLLASAGLLLISLPYLVHLYQSGKKEHSACPNFEEFTRSKNIHLDQIQSWRNHYTIGIDYEKNLLVYCRHGFYPVQTIVDLTLVDHVSVDSQFKELSAQKEKRRKLEYLDLVIHFKDTTKGSKSLPIYDESEVQHLADEFAIAKRWAGYIQQRISSAGQGGLQWAV
jgi:hypothetical protein